jgi:hypothetical protein
MVSTLRKILSLTLSVSVVLLLFLPKAQAQGQDILSFLNSVWIWAGWLLFLAFGIIFILVSIMIAPRFPGISRLLFGIGTFSLVGSLFLIELAYVLPFLQKGEISYSECQTIVQENVLATAACIIVGYAPTKEATSITSLSFWIFVVIIPLFILIYLFYDFVSISGMIENKNARAVIGVGFGFLAFRGFLASKFVNFLSYGLFGIALLVIDLILASGLLGYGNKFYRKWFEKSIERGKRREDATKTAREEVKKLLEALIDPKTPNPSEYFLKHKSEVEPYFDYLGLTKEFKALYDLAVAPKSKNELRTLAQKYLEEWKL